MFKDSYFQSSEILQNAVKCIDYVERLDLWIFVTVVTQFRNQNEYSYQTTLDCLPFNAMLCLENKSWSTPKSEIPTILPLL